MTHFYIGTQNSDFFHNLHLNLKNVHNKKIIIIVPEQYSFYTEKKMLSISKKLKTEIEVLSFSRLTHKIFKKFGGLTKINAQKANKIVTLCFALFQAKKNLPNYNFLINKPGFIDILLKTIEHVKHNQINLLEIKNNLKLIDNNNLKLKIKEFWHIFKLYNLKLNNNFCDSTDNLKHAIELCFIHDFFQNSEIFFLEFFSFSNSQLNFIETMIKQTNVHFYFYNKANCDIFTETTQTINKIKNIATKNNIKTSTITINCPILKSKALLNLEKILLNPFCEEIPKNFNNNDDIKIFEATSIFNEIEWVIIEIFKLIQINKFDFSDILILMTNVDTYKTSLICALNKFEIPFFMDDSICFHTMPLIQCCEILLKISCHTSEFITNCISLLKTDLTKFSTTQIALFENYIYTWNVTTKNFYSKFENSPHGLSEQNSKTAIDEVDLKTIEKIRMTILKAIKTIKLSQPSTKNIALNLMNALEILGVQNFIKNEKENKQLQQEWNNLILLIETIFKSTKHQNVSLLQFEFLFKTAAQNLNSKQIPQTLNSVVVGSIDQTIPTYPKITIILGATDLNLPKKQLTNNSLFSNDELIKLNTLKINFGKTLNEQNNLNQIMAHRAICGPTQKLFLTFSPNFSSNSTQPCDAIKTMIAHLKIPVLTEKNCLTFLNKCLNTKTTRTQLALHYNDDTVEAKSLKQFCKQAKISLECKNLIKPANCSNIDNLKLKCMNMSPSQIEQFFNCPFSYFCKYILSIKPTPKVELNKQHLGIAFHYVLEKILSTENFKNMPPYQIQNKVKQHLKNYLQTKLKQTQKLNPNIKNYNKIIAILCKNIQKELLYSNFEPTKFEHEIKQKINLNKNKFINIVGKIDRIDTQKIANKTLIRIIDYKTSSKKLSYSNLIYGLNLQMLIYAMAIAEKSKVENKFQELSLAAISYIKILGNMTNYAINERTPTTEKIDNIVNNGFFSNGLLFTNENVSLETTMKLLPFKLTKNQQIKKTDAENKIINSTELNLLFNFIKNKIEYMCKCVENGKFDYTMHHTNINSNENQTNCSYCPYNEICNPNTIKQIVHLPNLTKTQFLNFISTNETPPPNLI